MTEPGEGQRPPAAPPGLIAAAAIRPGGLVLDAARAIATGSGR
jgi:hypothetical protein